MPDGRELAIETTVAPGSAEVVHLVSKPPKNDEEKNAHPDVARGSVDQAGDPAVRAGAGASGFGLAGTLIGLAAKSSAVSMAFSA